MGPAPTIATVAPGCDLAVEHAAFEAGGQDVAQHHQRLLVGARGNRIEAGVGVGDADIFGLGAVDLVAQDPAAGRAMGVHPPAAILAFAAGGDAGDEDAVAGLERGHAGADLVDHAHAFMAQDAAGRAGRHIALEDVQIGAADRGLGDLRRWRRSVRRSPASADLRPPCSPAPDRRALSCPLLLGILAGGDKLAEHWPAQVES